MSNRWTPEELAAWQAKQKPGSRIALSPTRAELAPTPADEFTPVKKRVRQSSRPLLNRLEQEFYERLVVMDGHKKECVHPQALRFKISNGAWFKVDFVCFCPDRTVWAHEVKGPRGMKNQDRGMLALKCAASAFPHVRFFLNWKEKGMWNRQEILP